MKLSSIYNHNVPVNVIPVSWTSMRASRTRPGYFCRLFSILVGFDPSRDFLFVSFFFLLGVFSVLSSFLCILWHGAVFANWWCDFLFCDEQVTWDQVICYTLIVKISYMESLLPFLLLLIPGIISFYSVQFSTISSLYCSMYVKYGPGVSLLL